MRVTPLASSGKSVVPRYDWNVELVLLEKPVGWLGRFVCHEPRGKVIADAPLNILFMLVTLDTSQIFMSWLKRVFLNIANMSVTLEVSQLLISWLNCALFANPPVPNMLPMFVTLDVFQEPMFWLKARFSRNIPFIVVTLDVSHPPMSWLKEV